jgi:predicted ribosome quality control (RQC) complex YloA/Tae2 family protein
LIAQEKNKVLSKRDKEQSNRAKLMSDVFYAQNLFREAFPERRYGSVKAALYEAHRFLSRKVTKEFTYRRARSIHEGKARRIDAEEMEALKLALIEESKREQQNLRARLATLDEKIAAFEAAAHRQAMEGASHQMGR